MRFGELFAGVGGFGIGLERAGMEVVWQVEIDPWANQVLERHWPQVQRWTDIRAVDGSELPHVDLIAFGSPCQDLSVAGRRAGMAGERSGLFFEAARIIRAVAPEFALWENVYGALSSHGGRDFGAVLDALADAGALDICWRVLDAQFFGVPQRRRRVFLVADFGGHRAESILFESEGGTGDSAPSRAEGADIAYCLNAGSRGSGGGGRQPWNTTYVASGVTARYGKGTDSDADDTLLVARTLLRGGHGNNPLDETSLVAPWDERVITSADNRSSVELNAPAPDVNGGGELSIVTANSILASTGHHGPSSPRGDGSDNLIAFTNRGDVGGCTETLRATSHGAIPLVGVRRLTPRECERLMGWPDDWTRWTADGREIPDTHRYRLIGNGVVSNVVEWLGWRVKRALGQ